MSFRDFKSVGSVLREYPLDYRQGELFPDERRDVPQYLLDNFRFSLARRSADESEAFYTENFVYPLLQLVWRNHPRLQVWSHRPLVVTERLSGEPDYLVSPVPEGVSDRLIRNPLLAVVEAKRQDFDEGWGQCLAAMLASQTLNGNAPVTVYGIVSTGLLWEFGQLNGQRFTRHTSAYGLNDPALVHGMIDKLFAECEAQLPRLPPTN